MDSQTYGNGVTGTSSYLPSSGRVEQLNYQSTADVMQSLSYVHDSAGNLRRRSSARTQAENTVETFTYDNLHRLYSATTTWNGTSTRAINYRYDTLGNIKTKSDVSDINGYIYGEDGAGVHAVTSVALNGNTTQYRYDSKGNMTTRGEQTYTYAVFNKPLTINDSSTSTSFKYGPDRQRYYQLSNIDGVKTSTRLCGLPLSVNTD